MEYPGIKQRLTMRLWCYTPQACVPVIDWNQDHSRPFQTYRYEKRLALSAGSFRHSAWFLPLLCVLALTSQDSYLNAVLHSSLCLHRDCVRYVHNCLGLWEIFFSVVVLSYCIPTNYFNFVISMWFGVVIAVIDLQMDTMILRGKLCRIGLWMFVTGL